MTRAGDDHQGQGHLGAAEGTLDAQVGDHQQLPIPAQYQPNTSIMARSWLDQIHPVLALTGRIQDGQDGLRTCPMQQHHFI